MCTVTFLPLPDGGYLLGTNRDESHRRGRALPPSAFPIGDRQVLAPRDSDAGGTWVAVDDTGAALCLLNGDGAERVAPDPTAPSRGQLVFDLMDDPRPEAVAQALVRRRAEGALRQRPFKLLAAAPGDADAPRVLRVAWDGVDLRSVELAGPHVTVSSTHRRHEVEVARREAFEQLLSSMPNDPDAVRQALRAWHAGHAPGAAEGDAFSVCMHRDDARTVSSTLVAVTADRVEIDYHEGWPCEGGPQASRSLPRR